MEKAVPKEIPITRIIILIAAILTASALLTWQLTFYIRNESESYAYSRLYRQSEITCKWPKFSPFDRSLMKKSSYVRYIECPIVQPSFASLDSNGYLTVVAPLSSTKDYSTVRCTYAVLSADSVKGYHLDQPVSIQMNTRLLIRDEQFVVRCSYPNGDLIYEEAFLNIKARFDDGGQTSEDIVNERFKPSDDANPSLSLVILDNISRGHFARSLPKTLHLMGEQDFFMPNRYSQFYNSPELNLNMLLNGKDGVSLASIMSKRGCMVFSNLEPSSSPDGMSFYMNSSHADFSTTPMHSYNMIRQQNENCLSNGKSKVSSILSPLIDFSSSFTSTCHYSLTHMRTPTNHSHLGSIDQELSNTISRFITSRASERTILFILSPNGFTDDGLVGTVEGKSPLMAAWFPPAFRKVRNDHYSTFAWNMDKLFTTRDVHETFREVAEASFNETITIIDTDMEQSEVASLLGERLPEDRGCELVQVPDENCLCLDMDEQRNATANADMELFNRVFDLMTSRVIQQPCFEGTEIRESNQFVDSYQLLHREFINKGEPIEWLTIRFYAKLLNSTPRAMTKYITMEGTVRHYISSSRLEYIDCILLYAAECITLQLEKVCSSCYSQPFALLSSPGPHNGYLADVLNYVV